MSEEQLEKTVLSLSHEERRRFLDWLYEHEQELIGTDDDIHPEVKAEILRRRQEALAHPEKLEAWESAFPRMKQRFDELRRKNPHLRSKPDAPRTKLVCFSLLKPGRLIPRSFKRSLRGMD